MELKGKIKLVTPEQQVTDSYTKREVVITTDEQYPQHISIEFPQGKCNNEIDQLKVGEEVTIGINIGGREWINPQGEAKYFNSIKGWSVRTNTGTPPPAVAPQNTAPKRVLVMIATDFTYDSYKLAGWTDIQLIEAGKAKYVNQ
jgi:hypothetical protein